MNNVPRSRIDVYENGATIPIAKAPPLQSVLLSPDAVLERHATPHAEVYGDRELTGHVVFLSESDPVAVSTRLAGHTQDGKLCPGELWIIPAGLPYRAEFFGSHGGLVLWLGNDLFERLNSQLLEGQRAELRPQINLHDDTLAHLLYALREPLEGGVSDQQVGEFVLQAVCARLLKRYSESRHVRSPRSVMLPPARLRRVLDHVAENLDQPLNLASLAQVADLSLFYFAKLFKQAVGLSPHRYILQQRIDRAKELLLKTDLTMLDVSLQLGFPHQTNFTRAFRRITGTSPTAFRLDRC